MNGWQPDFRDRFVASHLNSSHPKRENIVLEPPKNRRLGSMFLLFPRKEHQLKNRKKMDGFPSSPLFFWLYFQLPAIRGVLKRPGVSKTLDFHGCPGAREAADQTLVELVGQSSHYQNLGPWDQMLVYFHCSVGLLGGGFKYFLFSSLPGEGFHFDSYFSKGLKPPTSLSFFFLKYANSRCPE